MAKRLNALHPSSGMALGRLCCVRNSSRGQQAGPHTYARQAKHIHTLCQGVQNHLLKPPFIQILVQAAHQPDAAAVSAPDGAHAKVQVDMFGRPEVVQEFMQPLPDEIQQVGLQALDVAHAMCLLVCMEVC